MIREMVGTKTVVSAFTNNKRKKAMIGAVSTIGAMAGLGIAYMTYRLRRAEE
jgi:hypothetical protein